MKNMAELANTSQDFTTKIFKLLLSYYPTSLVANDIERTGQ